MQAIESFSDVSELETVDDVRSRQIEDARLLADISSVLQREKGRDTMDSLLVEVQEGRASIAMVKVVLQTRPYQANGNEYGLWFSCEDEMKALADVAVFLRAHLARVLLGEKDDHAFHGELANLDSRLQAATRW